MALPEAADNKLVETTLEFEVTGKAVLTKGMPEDV